MGQRAGDRLVVGDVTAGDNVDLTLSAVSGEPSATDRFELREQLGAGGFGVVYRAYDTKMRREVALKRLTLQGDAGEMLLREQFATAPLSQHPNIVTLYEEVPEQQGGPYLVYELCKSPGEDGEQLRDWRELASAGIRLAGALATAHHLNIIHCDIKPANILTSAVGQPVLADFGMARMMDRSVLWQIQRGLTFEFSAPEVRAGEQQADKLSDVWSLAATLSVSLRQDGSAGCAALNEILGRAKRQDRSARTPSAVALANDLQALQRTYRLPVTEFPVTDAVDLGVHAATLVTTKVYVPFPEATEATQPGMPPSRPGADGARTGGEPTDLDLTTAQPHPVPSRGGRTKAMVAVVTTAALAGGGALLAQRVGGEGGAQTADSTPTSQGVEQGVSSTSAVSAASGAGLAAAGADPGTVTGTVVFTSDRGGSAQPFRFDLPGGAVTPLAAGLAGATAAVLSVDRSKAAVVVLREGKRALGVADLVGGELRIVENAGDAASPTWSPDGKSIAFASNRGGSWDVWVYDEATGSSTPLVAGSADETQPAWSPDGRRLALTSSQSGSTLVYTYDVATRAMSPASDSGRAQADPAWSPDGNSLAFSAEMDDGRSLFVADLRSGSTRRATVAAGSDRDPAFTQDGGHLVFVSDVADDQELFLLDLTSGERTRLTDNVGVDGSPTVIA